MPGAGHTALAPLVGSWHAELSIYGTMGRSPDLPPIVSRDIRTTRIWIADKQYIEDTTEGTVDGQPYWRRGWLDYSNMDRRYEWVTIAPRVPMMITRFWNSIGTAKYPNSIRNTKMLSIDSDHSIR